ncbi:MAG: hypothetical protein QM601_06280 [Pseudoxanthomonas sp.]
MSRSKKPPTTEEAPKSRKRASNSNRGSKPGERRGGRQPGTPNRVTSDIREALKQLLEQAAPKMAGWLERVAAEDPAKALDLALKAAEYAVPKLSRASIEVEDGNLADKLRAARARALEEIGRTDGAAFRREIEELMPPLIVVDTGVPQPDGDPDGLSDDTPAKGFPTPSRTREAELESAPVLPGQAPNAQVVSAGWRDRTDRPSRMRLMDDLNLEDY